MPRNELRGTSKAGRARTNLRTPASSFVGRREVLDALTSAFEEARLVTLFGPGGIGKTRLALRYAEERLASLTRVGRGGVWFVDLADAQTGLAALVQMAAVLGLPLAGHATERAMSEAIGQGLARLGPTLFVLDNVEQIAGFVARHVETWIGPAPSVRLLVTSRVVLGLPAERVLLVPPLSPSEARALFLDRAAAVRVMHASETEPALLDGIAAAIDRMPLAIELAASRMRVLSASELEERLVRPLEVLAGGVTHERHASMREAVLGSLALLDAGARLAFAALSILDHDFATAAALAVLGAIGATPRHPGAGEPLAWLDALVRNSLLRVEIGPDGRARHAFFETIREVAREELEQALHSGTLDLSVLRAAHVTQHAALARRARDGAGSAEPEHVAGELDHLLTARRYARALSMVEELVVITLALEPELSRRGLSTLREEVSSEAIAALDPAGPAALLAELHLGRGDARRELGEGSASRMDFETASTYAEAAGDLGLRAPALSRLGGAADLRGDTAGARSLLSSALALLGAMPRSRQRDGREAEVLLRLGHALRREGALEPAHASFVRARDLHRALGHDANLAAALYELGVVDMFRERVEQAFESFDEGLVVARRSGARIMEGACLTARGCLLQDLGRLREALSHHADAASLFRDHGSRYREGSALYYLASTYLERGEPEEALAALTRARRAVEDVGAARYDVLMSGGMALAFAALERDDEARAELFRAHLAIAKVPNEPSLATVLRIHERTLASRAGSRDVQSPEVELERARTAAHASPSDDTRFALRELERALGRATVEAHEALCVWGRGEAFLTPGGAKVTLPMRSPMRRVLDHLLTQRESKPGAPVSLESIIEAGWPGEKIGVDAALNRAYVAIASLRKQGLRDVIVRAGGGYAISQGVVVRRMEHGSSEP
jgi:predicted ATPase